jgi:hAT family dimerisation domain.
MLYKQLEDILNQITSKQGEYITYDKNLINVVKSGQEVFFKYNGLMKNNDIYFITMILDPRIKTKWIKNNLFETITTATIQHIRTFLKATYPPEIELPSLEVLAYKKESIQHSLLEEFQSVSLLDNVSDIDQYFDTPPIHFKLSISDNQIEWLINYWKTCKYEYLSMFQVVCDYLPIPRSEVDVERLFNTGRDILGIRRFSISGNTLRTLIMLKEALRV